MKDKDRMMIMAARRCAEDLGVGGIVVLAFDDAGRECGVICHGDTEDEYRIVAGIADKLQGMITSGTLAGPEKG